MRAAHIGGAALIVLLASASCVSDDSGNPDAATTQDAAPDVVQPVDAGQHDGAVDASGCAPCVLGASSIDHCCLQ